VFVVVSFWIAANVDIFVLSRFAPTADVGLYRLATRFGAFVSYFTSALVTAWTPLTQTSTFAAATQSWGKPKASGLIVTYFAIGSIGVLLMLTAGANVLVRLALSAYAGAAGLVPLAAGTFIATGCLTVIYRVSGRFPLKRLVYGSAVLAATGIFVGASFPLVPRFGAYGMAAAVILGFAVSTVAVALLMQRGRRPVELQYGRLSGAIAIGALCRRSRNAPHF